SPSHRPLALPALPSQIESQQQTIHVNGAPLVLDALGPMVVNRDGTISRIANWHEMAPVERENTLRILGKRNQLRLGNLRAGLAADAAAAAGGNGSGGGGDGGAADGGEKGGQQ
ncbi:hypothetical protein C8A05DRAFT_20248, partial [Staphylotrichum tortipilum]